jgi:hypothetical protein
MTSKQSARLAGACFLIAMVTSIAGGLLIAAVLDAPKDLAGLAGHKPQTMIGVLLELTNGVAVLGIAAAMFPILRAHHPTLAVGYVGNRIIEAVMQVLGSLIPVTLLTFGQQSVPAGVLEDSRLLQALGGLTLSLRAQAFAMLGIFFCLGAFLLYGALYRYRLVPRWLSVWGFVSVVLVSIQIVADLFGINAGMILPLPIIVNEITLGIWLIVKGFEPSAVASEPFR